MHIYYTGHSDLDGNLCLAGGEKWGFYELMEIILKFFKGWRVILELDCCYAGQWVEKAKKWFEEHKAANKR